MMDLLGLLAVWKTDARLRNGLLLCQADHLEEIFEYLLSHGYRLAGSLVLSPHARKL